MQIWQTRCRLARPAARLYQWQTATVTTTTTAIATAATTATTKLNSLGPVLLVPLLALRLRLPGLYCFHVAFIISRHFNSREATRLFMHFSTAGRSRSSSKRRSRRPGGVFQARFQIAPPPSRARRHGYGCRRPRAMNVSMCVYVCVCVANAVWTQLNVLPTAILRQIARRRASNETRQRRATQRSYCDFWQWIWNTQFAVRSGEWGV